MKIEGKILGYSKKILFFGGVLFLVALVSFYTGAKYEKYKLASLGFLRDTSKNPNIISFKGVLTAKNENSFTLKMEDGSEKNFLFEEKTTFGSRGKNTPQDFYIGHLLVVDGENKPDGTFTVQNIRKSKKSPKINPPQENINS